MALNLPPLDMSKFGVEPKPTALPSLDMTHFAPQSSTQPQARPVNAETTPPQSSSLLRRLGGDVGISALKGVIGLPEAVVGLADIPTLGYAGKLAESAGFRPKEARAILDEYLSPEQIAANKAVSEAKGFLPTVGAAIQNPSTIAHSVIESLPVMGGGGVIARGLKKSVESLSPYVAGAIGEGAVSGGLAAEQVRQQTDEGTLTPGQAAASFASGAGTAAFGAAGGRIAKKLGIVDIDTLLAGGGAGLTSKGVARRIIEGGISEGAFEELPQSVQEQIWQNAALGKPLLEGAPESGAMGLLAGGVMGGIAGGLTGGKTGQVQPDQGTPFPPSQFMQNKLPPAPPAAPPAGPESPLTRAAQAGGISVSGIESADLGPIEEITLQSRPGPLDAELAGLEQSIGRPPSTTGLEATDLTTQEVGLEGGVSQQRQAYLDSLVPITEDITVQGGVSPERAANQAQLADLRSLPAPAPRLPAPSPVADQLDRLREATADAQLGPISRAARVSPPYSLPAPTAATKTPQEPPAVAVATPVSAPPQAAPALPAAAGQTEAIAPDTGRPQQAPRPVIREGLPLGRAKMVAAQLTATGNPPRVEQTEPGKFAVVPGEADTVEKPKEATLSPISLQQEPSADFIKKAEAIGKKKGLLKLRLNTERGRLAKEYRQKFGQGTLDFDNKRLVSDDGTLALQWSNDGKTNRGTVTLTKNAAPVEKTTEPTIPPVSLQPADRPVKSVATPEVPLKTPTDGPSVAPEAAQTPTPPTTQGQAVETPPGEKAEAVASEHEAVADMQNRERDRPVSIQQMQAIANNPDADRLSFSPVPDSGAPMVHAVGQSNIPESDLGKQSVVTMADGSKVPVRYAVVEADSVLASHNADGTANSDYGTPPSGTLRALTNGRTAGLQAAYRRGTADNYKSGISGLTDQHGVSPDAIAAKQRPMVIRLYDETANRSDMGRLSNVSQGLGLSVTETALNDARAIDMSNFRPGENGEMLTASNRDFLKAFMAQIPANERAAMIDGNGNYTKQFADRVQAAVFAKAYRDTELLALFAETADPDIKNVLQALTIAAPEFAKIKDAGDLDIRPYIVGAVNFIKDAKAGGKTIDVALSQHDLLGRDPLVDRMADFMGRNIRSPRRMGEALAESSRFIQNETKHKATGDMFGGRGTSLDDVIGRINSYLTEKYGDEARTIQNDIFKQAGETPVSERAAEPGKRQGKPPQVERTEAVAAKPAEEITTLAGEPAGPTPPQGGVSTTAKAEPPSAVKEVETRPEQTHTVTEETGNEPTKHPTRLEAGDRGRDSEARIDRAEDSGQVGVGLGKRDASDGEGRDTAAAPQGGERVRGGDNLPGQIGRRDESPSEPRDSGTVRTEPGTVSHAHDFTITDADEIGAGGLKTKYQNNVAAIRLLKQLEEEGRRSSADEQAVLAKYVGWGGIKGAFDQNNKQWAKEYAELNEILTDEEYQAARRSILDAHYTSVPIINAIWSALDRMGFKGGRVLEPSVGVGNFFGLMPAGVRAKSSMYGVELDRITAGIARQLYQTADIAGPVGFHDVNIPANSYDVVVGNPPFGSQSIYDKNHPELKKFSIHNFFFAKSLDKVRPGGLMAMVVSRYFMDAQDSTAREWIAKDARLVAAFRLPYTAFKGNANTEVVTDIIILQKSSDTVADSDVDWVKTVDVDVDGTPKRINQYFADNPKNVIGRLATTGSMYSKDELTVEPVGDFEKALAERIETVPEDAYSPETHAQPTAAKDLAEGVAPNTTKIGAYFITPDGNLAMREPDSHRTDENGNPLTTHRVIADMPKATEDRVRGMVNVRESLRDLIRLELTDRAENSTRLQGLRHRLNVEYERFKDKFGYINALGNRRAFQDDPDLPLLESLEPEYDPGVSAAVAKSKGIKPRQPKADKAAIFTKRVLAPYTKVEKVDNASDALTASMNEKGGVDLDYMAVISGLDSDALIRELTGLIYQNPENRLWELADTYLSGNVKAKLKQAHHAAKQDREYSANVEALEKVQPADLTASDISAQIGAGWVPADVITAFGRELLGTEPSVHYIGAIGRWSFKAKGDGTAHTATWGTSRVPAGEIIDHLLNAKAIVVKDNHGTSREPQWVVNDVETQAARAKADDVAQKFKGWIWDDQKRRERLEKIYNDTMNTDRLVTRDGSHLTLPGSNPTVKLRPHQLAGVWRVIQDRGVLLDHVVGAGKTYEMTASAMELRRLGLARKPMFAVPNHLVRQWRDEFYRLYPNANILATTEKDFQKANRQKLFSRITTGNWDAVIVAHSSFKKVGMPPDMEAEILNEMLKDISDAIEDMKAERGDRNVMRDMERIKENLEAKMDRLKETGGKKDNVVTFDELGVDALFLDEAHLYKNLFYHSQMQGVTGLGNPSGSGRAFDMFVKTRYLQKHYGGRAPIVFATGTPVSNSLVEMFTMQRYMMYDDLRARGIHLLDPWAKMFGEVQNVYEVHPSGNGYRLATRFAKFQNLGELMKLYRGFADVITMDDLKAQSAAVGQRFPVPKLKGGKPNLVVAERSAQQTEFFGVPVFGRGEGGTIQFKHNDLTVAANKDGKYEVRKDKNKIAGPFDTESEAREESIRLMSDPVVEYNENSILWKFENLRKLTKDSDGKINALSITNEARKAGLDFRLIDPNAPDFAGSKINLAVSKIVEVYKQWSKDRGTQLVFSDLSVPASARDKILREAAKQAEKTAAESLENEDASSTEKDTADEAPAEEEESKISMDQLLATKSKFSVYDDVKAKLIKAGIPDNEVAFIHDYDTADKKQKLFQAVRDGRIRILLGSTEKMGAGMNVQDRLVAIHHLDAPWRPSDLEQRNGRIMRQGNKLYERDPDGFEVQESRYATKQTYDTRMWQIIEHKARGIEQLRKADESTRTMDDIAGEAASSADMKAAASGNPLILDEIKLRTEIRNLEAQESNHNRAKYDLQRKMVFLEKSDERHDQRNSDLKKWIDIRAKHPDDKDFSVKIGDKTYAERKDMAAPMVSKLKDAAAKIGSLVEAGVYRGVRFGFQSQVSTDDMSAKVSTDGKNWRILTVYGRKDEFSPVGLLTRIDNILKGLDAEVENSARTLNSEKAELIKVRDEADKPFTKKEHLVDTRRRHREIVLKLQKSGGAISLSSEMRRELNDALKERGLPLLEDVKFSRPSGVSAGTTGTTAPTARKLLVSTFGETAIRNLEKNGILKIVQNKYGLPDEVRGNLRGDEEGVYYNGTGYLIADNLAEGRIVPALLHEVGEHYGLEKMLGENAYKRLMVRIRMMKGTPRVKEAWAAVIKEYPHLEEGKSDFMHEVMARLGEHADVRSKPWYKQIVQAIRLFLLKIGFTRHLSDKHIGELLLASLRKSAEGGPVVIGSSELSLASRKSDVFYSALARGIESAKQTKASAAEWKAIIAKMEGVKKDEVEAVGLNEYLDLQTGQVSREQVLEFVRQNGVQVKEVTLGGAQLPKRERNQLRETIVDWIRSQPNSTVHDNEMEGYGLHEEAESIAAAAADGNADAVGQLEALGAPDRILDVLHRAPATKFSQWQLPGGENYRELLLTLPEVRGQQKFDASKVEIKRNLRSVTQGSTTIEYDGKHLATYSDDPQLQDGGGYKQKSDEHWMSVAQRLFEKGDERNSIQGKSGAFRSSHFDESNILVHVRLNERTDAEGKRVLFIEEVQSDWHQRGRKQGYGPGDIVKPIGISAVKDAQHWRVQDESGNTIRLLGVNSFNTSDEAVAYYNSLPDAEIAYRKDTVPDAPFKTTWPMLAMKRMIRYASENGFDRVAWTTGTQQFDRWGSQEVSWVKNGDSWRVNATEQVGGNAGGVDIEGAARARGILKENKGTIVRSKDDLVKVIRSVIREDESAEKIADRIWPRMQQEDAGTSLPRKEGMIAFYDQMLPQMVNKYVKKWGGRVSKTAFDLGDPEDAVALPTADMIDEGGFTAHSLDITDSIRQSVMQGQPMFSRPSIIGDTGRARTPEQIAAFRRIGREVEIPTIQERMKSLWKDAGKKLAQGLVDQFAPIKDISREAYALLRLSKGASGAFDVFLNGGRLKLSDGVYDFDEAKRGGVIDRLLVPLQGEADDFMWWVAGNRAEQLSKEDREHLFTPDDISAMKSLADGDVPFDYTLQHGPKAGTVTRKRTEVYKDSLATFNEFHKNALDMAEQSNMIDGASRKFWEKEFYVPFYRLIDDDPSGVRGMNIKSGVVRQQAFKRLKGGTGKLSSDLLENTLMNWAHLLDASAKNRAAEASLKAAEAIGAARKAVYGEKNTVWHMGEVTRKIPAGVEYTDGGVRKISDGTAEYKTIGKVEYVVDDPHILTAISALEYAGMRGPLMDAMGTFKHALTIGVTASPFFKVRNLIRDSVQAIGTSPLSYNVAGNVAGGWKLTDPKSDAYFRLLAGGGTIHFGTMLEGSESKRVRALVESGVDERTILDNEGKLKAFYKRMIEPAITAYNELGNRGEAINRAALYDQLIKQGKSHAEASLLARDLMDFSMQGAWTGIRFLTQTVPFMNARMQGIYKLGRSFKDDPKKISVVLGATATLSIALMLAYSDDDDWKKREDWDRDNYWWFKVGGVAFRVPKPFEIGAMATLAERGVELFSSDEMTGERFRNRLYHLLSDNLAFNPVPQLVKPVLDVYANKDSFTGRPIETLGMERIRPDYRYTGRTSMAARAIGTAGNIATGDHFLSPVQVDHLIMGYFGWLGSFIVGASDILAKPTTGQPSGPRPDYWKLATGSMVSGMRDAPSRYVSQMYDQAKENNEAYGTWRSLIKEGRVEEARSFFESNREKIAKHRLTARITRMETSLNERIRRIEKSDRTSEEKRDLIREIKVQKDRIARSAAQ